MKVRFNGVIEETQRGCRPCHGRTTHTHMVTHKAYYLPSGQRVLFRVGVAYEVSEEDGKYLLSETYKASNGKTKKVFEVWQA